MSNIGDIFTALIISDAVDKHRQKKAEKRARDIKLLPKIAQRAYEFNEITMLERMKYRPKQFWITMAISLVITLGILWLFLGDFIMSYLK